MASSSQESVLGWRTPLAYPTYPRSVTSSRNFSLPANAPRDHLDSSSAASRRLTSANLNSLRDLPPLTSSRTHSRSGTPYPSSPRLPALPRRGRLSVRPPSHQFKSSDYDQHSEVHDDCLIDDLPSLEDADALNEIIMAIDMKDGGTKGFRLGCAYYVALDESLYLLEDVPMAGVELIETLLLHAKPTTVLVPSRASENLIQCLSKGAQSVNSNQGDLQGAYILRNLNSGDFRYSTGKDKLLSLNFAMQGPQSMLYMSAVDDDLDVADMYESYGGSRQSRMMKLGTAINLDSELTVGCAGALLRDIERRKTAQYQPDDPDASVAFGIKSVEIFSLFNSMFVNADTMSSLQILDSEQHPSSHQQGPAGSNSGAKESLSILGLFQYMAVTPQGKNKLRQIFLRPSTDIDLINARQRTLSFFLQPGHSEALESLTKCLKNIKNMKNILSLLKKGIDNPGKKISVGNNVWVSLTKFAASSLQIRDILRAIPHSTNIDLIEKIIEIIDPMSMRQVGELIAQTIDIDQSIERGKTTVKSGVDTTLDELKRTYDGMDQFLTAVVKKLRDKIPEWARSYLKNCMFFPQLGFLTVVSLNMTTKKGNYDGEGLDEVWESMFVAEGCVYYKNRQMKEMDRKFGDAYCMIIDREIEIIHDLAVAVMDRENPLVSTSEVIGELDSLIALAVGCGRYQWNAPTMTSDNIIDIEEGRHPLQELVVRSFVANDCHLVGGPGEQENEMNCIDEQSMEIEQVFGDYSSTFVLTGPNHSGKSVYLKQVALIVYLAHIGCFVPAKSARIGITDRIFTRIATRESMGRNESAFATDLRQVAFAMNFATRRSLVLIDEFGKGTNSSDGAGLMTATLDHFDSLGPDRPKVLAATHFHEIFEGDFLVESPTVAFAHMNVQLDYDATTLDDQVTYTYRLVPGRSISSFGSRCAAMNGIDQAIVDRAESLVVQIARNEDLQVVCSQLSEAEVQRLEEAEKVARTFLEQEFMQPPRHLKKTEVKDWFAKKLEQVF
ncbi:muts domain V-domain-containing protein [Xylariaceae sp. FL0016]|nr:muts domain V-domain-containing protein [Xylariaceae sp. FL0016]